MAVAMAPPARPLPGDVRGDADGDSAGDGREDEVGLDDGFPGAEDGAVAEVGAHGAGDVQREARLPDAGRAGQGHRRTAGSEEGLAEAPPLARAR